MMMILIPTSNQNIELLKPLPEKMKPTFSYPSAIGSTASIECSP
jgi:hypothetical protein